MERKARKEHICQVCGQPIVKGEIYWSEEDTNFIAHHHSMGSHHGAGSFYTHATRTHLRCKDKKIQDKISPISDFLEDEFKQYLEKGTIPERYEMWLDGTIRIKV